MASVNSPPIYRLDFRRGVVEELMSDELPDAATEIPPAPPGVTFASLGTPPPQNDSPPAGS